MTDARLPARVRRFALAFASVLGALAFVIWTIWGALSVGGSGSADARIAAALTLASLIPAVAVGLVYALEDKL